MARNKYVFTGLSPRNSIIVHLPTPVALPARRRGSFPETIEYLLGKRTPLAKVTGSDKKK
jgi:hypothetical protein